MLVTADNPAATPLVLVSTDGLQAWREGQSALAQAWLARGGFKAKPGQFAWLPNAAGEPALVAVGCGAKPALGTLGRLAFRLAAGDYRLEGELSPAERHQVLLGWGLGAYRFAGYKDQPGREPARLLTHTTDAAAHDECTAVALCRDLINTPANDMLPHHLEAAARELAAAHGADVEVTVGDALLERGLRTIHAVGRASAAAPRLIDLRWGTAKHPQVVLVGKGVCFDSGGLDLKTAAGMRLMKKDMGGAAHALGLAKLIMAHGLPVALRVLVPAVENAVAGQRLSPRRRAARLRRHHHRNRQHRRRRAADTVRRAGAGGRGVTRRHHRLRHAHRRGASGFGDGLAGHVRNGRCHRAAHRRGR